MRHACLVLLPLLAGCAAVPPRTPDTAACRDFFEALDRRIDAADVRDAGAFPVPGHPYLRTDRLLASFAPDVADAPRFEAWVERLRRRDLEARAIELRNLDAAEAAGLTAGVERCGRTLASLELADAAARERLRAAAEAPDDYSLARRTLGLYPLAVPFLNLGIRGYHDEVREDFALPLERLDSPGAVLLFEPPPGSAPPAALARRVQSAKRDPLGFPKLSPSLWQALAVAHAPAWWVEHGGDFDHPGAPLRGAEGPGFDDSLPVTYVEPGFTRFGDEVLPTLAYTVWFSERPGDGFDPYGGALDGVVWRVTLGADGRPLVYDSIHPCGCYRQVFPAQPLARRDAGGFWQEPVLFPQAAVPAEPLAVRLRSGTHFIRRVVARRELAAQGVAAQPYALRDYATLLALPDGPRTRSLFDEDGVVDGTERLERTWLWFTGVGSPGAMRQSGRQATSFVGRSHFDDARWMEQYFAAPGE